MIMNHRFGRTLVLLAILSAPVQATAGATDSGASRSDVHFTSANPDKAAEAKRLAAQAAELAQRAAALAAESQAEQAAASTPKQINVATKAPTWNAAGAAEVMISDADSQPAASPVPSIGWRSHRAASDSAIRFANPGASAKPAALAARARDIKSDASTGSELKLSDLTTAAQNIAQKTAAAAAVAALKDTAAPLPKESKTAQAETATQKNQPAAAGNTASQTHKDDNVKQAATKIEDSKVRRADSEEPMPAPADPYDGGKVLGNGENEPCECVDAGCCPPRRPLFWTSGVEATFLNPDLNEGVAAFQAVEFNEERIDEVSTTNDDVDSIYMAPRIWVGVQGCLWGANLRYFHLRANEGSFDPTLGTDGEWDGPRCGIVDFGYDSYNALEAYTVDLEITRRVCLHDCWMQFSAGVRHAELEHDASLFGTALADDSQIFGFAEAHRVSRGTGLVFGWYGRRPIFPCSCIHWFYNAHWSALWGPTNTAAETGVMLALTSQDPTAVATAGSVNSASTHVSDNLFIGEIQLGLEWDYALRCLPANAFCRAAVEYQRWSGGKGFSFANSFAGVEIDDDPTTFADAIALADSPELDLIGLSVSTGLTW